VTEAAVFTLCGVVLNVGEGYAFVSAMPQSV
jgi:hypothetical protein